VHLIIVPLQVIYLLNLQYNVIGKMSRADLDLKISSSENTAQRQVMWVLTTTLIHAGTGQAADFVFLITAAVHEEPTQSNHKVSSRKLRVWNNNIHGGSKVYTP